MPHVPGTDLFVSPLGLGTYQAAGVFGPVRPEDFIHLTQVAYAEGITFFDTAPSYGDGEIWLGRALAPVRNQVVISSKFHLPKASCSAVAATITASCDNSLRRLASEYIDLYHLHYDEESLPQETVIATLEKLKSDGKIRYYGLSDVSAQRLRTYREMGRFSTLMLELHPLAPPALMRLKQEASSLALIGYSVTGRGMLTGRFPRDVVLQTGDIRHHDPLFQRENLAAGRRIVDYLRELGRHLGKTPAQLVIAWALAKEGIASVLTTTTSEAHLQENLEGAAYQWPPGAWEEFSAFLERVLEEARRSREETVAQLLTDPLHPNPATARSDLIYLVESMDGDEVVPAHVLVPICLQLQESKNPEQLQRVFHRLQELRRQSG